MSTEMPTWGVIGEFGKILRTANVAQPNADPDYVNDEMPTWVDYKYKGKTYRITYPDGWPASDIYDGKKLPYVELISGRDIDDSGSLATI